MPSSLPSASKKSASYVAWFALPLLVVLSVTPFRLPRLDESSVSMRPERLLSARPPIVSKVVVVIIDGLGMNAATHPGWMPHLTALAEHGAFGIAQANFPTMTTTGITAIATGRRPPPGMGFPGGIRPDPEYDSVLSRASADGLRTFVEGQQDWDALFPAAGARMATFPYHGEPLDHDERILRDSIEIMKGKRGRWNLLYVHLFDLDPTGHLHGMNSPEYARKLAWVDAHLEDFVRAAGPGACVLFTADHGQLPNGSHGGIEPAVRNVPLLILGKRARRTEFGKVDQRDIAATVAGLLGIGQPALSSGWPILDAFDFSARERAEIMIDVLKQRRAKRDAVQTEWSWIIGNPDEQLSRADRLLARGEPVKAEAVARGAAAAIDELLDNLSPRRWFGRGVLSAWLATLAICFALAWPFPGRFSTPLAAGFALIRVAALLISIPVPSLAPFTTLLSIATSAALCAIALSAGYRHEAMLGLLEGVALSIALLALACPFLVDATLWAWLGIWTALVVRVLRSFQHDRREVPPLFSGVLAIAAASVISSWTPSLESSVLRSALPSFQLRQIAVFNWTSIQAALWVVIASWLGMRVRRLEDPAQRLAFAAWGLVIIGGSFVTAHLRPEFTEWLWLASLGSLTIFLLRRVPSPMVGIWLSLLGLGYCQTLAAGRAVCFLQLAVLAGWSLCSVRRPRSDLGQGFEIFALCLWSALCTNNRLDFSMSEITVSEAYAVLGHQWHPHVLVIVIALKYAMLVLTPALPLLVDLQWRRLLGLAPFLGAWCAGNLTILWVQQFFVGKNVSILVNDPAYEVLLWCVFFAWSIVGLWSAIKGFQRLSAKSRQWLLRSPIRPWVWALER